jgi:hypothetical protein
LGTPSLIRKRSPRSPKSEKQKLTADYAEDMDQEGVGYVGKPKAAGVYAKEAMHLL